MATTAPRFPLRLSIILGSTREHRFGTTVTRWFTDQTTKHPDIKAELLDLAKADAPTVHRSDLEPGMRNFVDRVNAADAFVVVTPEYNHGYPASLKSAIDSAYDEWHAKPVGFVSYGGISGGLRAVEQLRQVFAELHAVTVRDTVSFHNAHDAFDAHGHPHDGEGPSQAAKTMLDQLTWWGTALRDARARVPYRG